MTVKFEKSYTCVTIIGYANIYAKKGIMQYQVLYLFEYPIRSSSNEQQKPYCLSQLGTNSEGSYAESKKNHK